MSTGPGWMNEYRRHPRIVLAGVIVILLALGAAGAKAAGIIPSLSPVVVPASQVTSTQPQSSKGAAGIKIPDLTAAPAAGRAPRHARHLLIPRQGSPTARTVLAPAPPVVRTATPTATWTATPTVTATATVTPTATASATPADTPTASVTPTGTETPTASPAPAPSLSGP